ncbi:MAG TPA: lipid-A-disaccharide synthase [Steroidobacteraceae bacterium]|nr:lipid-A-disaccharide synthase [Steroidobacteraceae bacterium]
MSEGTAGGHPAPRIALVAGEASGDNLGAGLIRALRARLPGAQFCGIAGPRMQEEGCEAWASSDALAVMGLAEVLKHLPRLLRLRRELEERLVREPPDVFVGIDAPEFNLGLAARLRARGLRTVQYVSPQVWAWRQGRVRKIGRAVDLVLCLLPFERAFYDEHGVPAEFVGHPLADLIPLENPAHAARERLGIAGDGPVIAVLPGSRLGEIARLGPDFAATVAWLTGRLEHSVVLAPMASSAARTQFEAALRHAGVADRVRLLDGQAQLAMAAADAVLLASGTATLEATLVKRPMVVAYRLSGLTTLVLRTFGLMKAPYFAQPNLLAGRKVVPEYFNDEVRADVLGPALLEQLERPDRAELQQTFLTIHERLRQGASERAAAAITGLIVAPAGPLVAGA